MQFDRDSVRKLPPRVPPGIAWILAVISLVGFATTGVFVSEVAGGEPSSGVASLHWQHLPELPGELGVAGPFVGVHGNALIVAGGANFPRPVWVNEKVWRDHIYVLVNDGASVAWRDGGRLKRPIAYGASVSTREGVVCMGGNDSRHLFEDVFMLRWNRDEQAIVRTDLPSLPRPCAYGQAVSIGSVIYLIGGQCESGLESAMQNVWTLDLAKRDTGDAFRWQEMTPFPGPSRAFNLTVSASNGSEQCVYVLSGRRQSGKQVEFLTDAWEYTPSSRHWRRVADLPRCVMAGTGIGIENGRLLVLGGASGELFSKADELKDEHPGFPKQAFVFETTKNRWSSAGPIPLNHVTTTPVRWDDRIILPSGEIRPRVRTTKVWSITLNRE